MTKLIILDRDGVINRNSHNPSSPFYYITKKEDFILLPMADRGVRYCMRIAPVVLATKQRCISKGLVTRQQVDEINKHLEDVVGVRFDAIYVEEEEKTKFELFLKIIADYQVEPSECLVIDDSTSECTVARGLGMKAIQTTDLDATAERLLYKHKPLLIVVAVLVFILYIMFLL